MNLDDSQLDRLLDAVEAPDLDGTPYRLLEELGRGGMGVVYKVLDERLGREVALKVVEGSPLEARITASLEHPGIVPVHEAGTLSDGRSYYTMRLVRGAPLPAYVSSTLGLAARIGVFQKVCEAVAYAHSRGVLHRDLKPSNIMVGAFGEVAVLDWGMSGVDPRRTAGTPGFMAPERGEADARVDIYALGAVLAWLLPADAPRALLSIAAKASAPDASARYQTVEELRTDLSRYLDGFAVEAHREAPHERAARFVRRNKTLLLLVGAYFAVRIGVYFFSGR